MLVGAWYLPSQIEAAAGDSKPIDRIYDASVLQDRQYRYAKFFTGIFDQAVKLHLTDAETVALSNVNIKVVQVTNGREPFGFYSNRDGITLSAASLKFFNDLIVSYEWLGNHGYGVQTIDDYLRMLAMWRQAVPPPDPLKALGIPDDARDDKKTDDQATDLIRQLYLTILLHELGHIYHKDNLTADAGIEMSRLREIEADRFALDFMARTGQVPDGYATFCEWQWDLTPNRAYFASDGDYARFIAGQAHPLSTQRLVTVADDLEKHWDQYANGATTENRRAFLKLAELLRKMAAVQNDVAFQQDVARRAKVLEPADLAPRRLGELLGRPPGTHAADGPYQGEMVGKVVGKSGVSLDVEMLVDNMNGRVAGTIAMGSELVRIRGQLAGDTLSLHWQSADFEGNGMLRRKGDEYEGSSTDWPTPGSSVWKLKASKVQNQ